MKTLKEIIEEILEKYEPKSSKIGHRDPSMGLNPDRKGGYSGVAGTHYWIWFIK